MKTFVLKVSLEQAVSWMCRCQGLGEGEDGELVFNGDRVLVLQEKKSYGGGWRDSSTAM